MTVQLREGQYLSRVIGSANLDHLSITETSYTPKMRLPRHAHERPCFIVVLEGSFSETCGGSTRTCKAHTIIVRPAGDVHSNDFLHHGGRCLNIETEPSWLEEFETAPLFPLRSVLYAPFDSNRLASSLYGEYRDPDDLSAVAIECMLVQLLDDIAGIHRVVGGTRPSWLETVKELIHASFREPLMLSTLARTVSVHPVHVATIFSRHYGCTIGEYRRRLKIEFARRALERSGLPLSVISAASGFYDQSHFTRTFKRLTGLTPGAYRNAVAETTTRKRIV